MPVRDHGHHPHHGGLVPDGLTFPVPLVDIEFVATALTGGYGQSMHEGESPRTRSASVYSFQALPRQQEVTMLVSKWFLLQIPVGVLLLIIGW